MRAPTELDQRDAMLAQVVEAFMAADTMRYCEACAWLCDYAIKVRQRSGKVRINENWYDPAKMDGWRKALRAAGRKGGWAKRRTYL